MFVTCNSYTIYLKQFMLFETISVKPYNYFTKRHRVLNDSHLTKFKFNMIWSLVKIYLKTYLQLTKSILLFLDICNVKKQYYASV